MQVELSVTAEAGGVRQPRPHRGPSIGGIGSYAHSGEDLSIALSASNISNGGIPVRLTRPPSLISQHSSLQNMTMSDESKDRPSDEVLDAMFKLTHSIERTNALLRKHTETLTFMRQTIFRAYSKSISSPTERGIEIKTPVEVRCCFLRIVDVNTLKQNFEAEIFIEARWNEPNLGGISEKCRLQWAFSVLAMSRPYIAKILPHLTRVGIDRSLNSMTINFHETIQELRNIDYSQYWNPKLMVLNVDGSPTSERTSYSAKLAPSLSASPSSSVASTLATPILIMRRRIKGVFRENLELQHFPFDVQELTIQVSTERSADEVELLEDQQSLSTVNTEAFLDSQEWKIYEHVEITKTFTTVEDASATTRPILHVQCRVARKVGYFFWNIVFVMFLISTLSFTGFSIETTVPNRLQTTITLLLTAVAFKMVTKQHLPTISYLTYLDIYVIASLVFLALQATQNAAASAAVQNKTGKAAMIDLISIQILLAIVVLFHVIFGVYIYRTAFRRRRLMASKDREYQMRKKRLDRIKSSVVVNASGPNEHAGPTVPFL